MNENIIWHNYKISKQKRYKIKNQIPVIIWFTGLSGSGKSTVANKLDELLYDNKNHTYILDGDNIRTGINKDLDFTESGRIENIRRTGEVAKLFIDSGLIVITSFISPFRKERDSVRNLVKKNEFIEVFVKCPIEECERRDPKKLYRKARKGLISNFTGISSNYEEPKNPEIVIDTLNCSIENCAHIIYEYLVQNKYVN